MAVEYMTSVNIGEYDPGINNEAWEYDSGDVTASGNWVLLPANLTSIVITLEVQASSSGSIQTTTNKIQDIIDDNDVVAVTWSSGTVASTTQDTSNPVSAIKVIRTTGTVRMMIRAQ